eukprot:2266727-Pleurochrysis_carterae.AAC.3
MLGASHCKGHTYARTMQHSPCRHVLSSAPIKHLLAAPRQECCTARSSYVCRKRIRILEMIQCAYINFGRASTRSDWHGSSAWATE